jgi:hypothetical protein
MAVDIVNSVFDFLIDVHQKRHSVFFLSELAFQILFF